MILGGFNVKDKPQNTSLIFDINNHKVARFGKLQEPRGYAGAM